MGYFGFSFFEENQDKVKALEIDGGKGCVAPSPQSAQDGSYYLSRPLFVYASADALKNPAVDQFLNFYEDNVVAIADKTGFIPMTSEQAAASKQKLQQISGT